MEVRRRLLVAHPPGRMYDLIEGAEHYPAFLPWCRHATVLERTDAVVAARIAVDWHGVRFEFVTRNLKRRPEWMGVRLAEGPFREFDGEWVLTPLGQDGCRIEFAFRYDFENPLLRRVAGHVFERITNTLADAFVQRADALGDRIPALAPVEPAHAASTPVMPASGPRGPSMPDASATDPPRADTSTDPKPDGPP